MSVVTESATHASLPPTPSHAGNGGSRNIRRGDDRLRTLQRNSPPPGSSAIWVGIAAITMMFAAFTSALVVREGSGPDWQHIAIPHILLWNTLVLIASSLSLETFRRRFVVRPVGAETALRVQPQWLYASLLMGIVFVAGQYAAWIQLRREGVYVARNPSSSFFYVLTAAHALHVIGGLGGLLYVTDRLRRHALRRSTLDVAATYWHFMDVLWIYLLALIWVKL
jgi:cytochrome c oxidase subunit 3